MPKPETNIQLQNNNTSFEYPLTSIVAALVLLLHKYSNYVSEVVNIEIHCKGIGIDTKILFSKDVSTKGSWDEFQQVVHDDVATLLQPSKFSEVRNIDLNWVTDNDEPGTEYKIEISPSEKNNFRIKFQASEKAFYRKAFQNAIVHIKTLLNEIGANPSKSLFEIEYLSEEEKETLKTFNYGVISEEVAKPELLHHLFQQTVSRFPDNEAIISSTRRLSYSELNSKANSLAVILISKGIKPGDFIGILLKRSPEVYISMLAILKSGAAYVPLDVGYPEDRISYILSDCGVKLLISNETSYNKHLDLSCELLSFDEQLHSTLIKEKQTEAPQVNIPFTSPAYVIYTSGSTGRPKGVVIPHLSISNLVKAEEQLFQVGPKDRVMQGFSVAFDASVEEIWLALRSGAALVPASEDVMHSGADLSEFIKENNISVVSTVPTMLSMMQGPLPSLHLLILGGEYCPHELIQRWHTDKLRIVNTYGPTEATVIATYADFDPNTRITIGKPVINYSTFILDTNLLPVATGIPGELCIGGASLAHGYLNRDELSAEKFTNPPFVVNENHPQRIYRTGDLVRFNEEGNIEFLGRIDSQVKLRGYRIELSEIESQIMQVEGIKNAVVAVKEDEFKVQRLIAYIILKDKKSVFDEEFCKSQIKGKLASYMVPSVFMQMEEFPVLPSGKVDRKKLPEPIKVVKGQNRIIVTPRTETETKIFLLWEKFFSPQPVSVTDDFFDLGGHSLLASLIISEMRKTPLLTRVSVQDMYTCRTLEKLSEYIDKQNEASEENKKTTKPKEVKKKTSDGTYVFTTIAQMLSLMLFFLVGSVGLLSPFFIERANPDISDYRLIFYSVLSIFFTLPVMMIVSIIIKWLLVGKIKEGHYPLWGWYYFRFWLMKKFIDITPLALISGTPFITIYFRLLGAKIGKGVFMGSDRVRAFDLTTIGDDSSVSREAHLMGYIVEDGELIIGRVTIGKNCFIGTRSVISENAVMEDGASLAELSLLPADQKIPAKENWKGSPAVKIKNTEETNQAKKQVRGLPFSIYLALQFIAFLFVFLFPLILTIPFVLIFYETDLHYGFGWALATTVPNTAIYIVLFCLLIALCKWIIIGKVKEEQFSIYSFRYIRKWTVDMLMSLSLISFRAIYATIYLPSWLRLMGAKVGKASEISTVNQMSTDLFNMGAGSFLADSVSIGSPEVKNKVMNLKSISIGEKTFIGNSAVVACGDYVGNHCLLGVLSTPPENDNKKMEDGSSWLGSPPMFLPQRQVGEKFSDELTFNPSKWMYLKRGIIEFFKITLPSAFTTVIIAVFYLIMYNILEDGKSLHYLWLVPVILFLLLLAAPLITLLFKYVLIGKYIPSNKPLWSGFVWNNELVNALCESMVYPLLVNLFLGTPFAPVFFRMMGSKIGKRVYMETTEITEFDLAHIGDYSCINHLCTIQTHLFEDRVMKMSHLHIGKNCTMGPMSVVLYDSVMEDHSTIDSLSLVMKGEVIPKDTKWAGSPAKFVC